MKRLMSAAGFMAAMALVPNTTPADATFAKPCLQEAIGSCNADFPGEAPQIVAIRGYCYIIRAAMCAAGW